MNPPAPHIPLRKRYRNARVLVTGGAGFIGSRLTEMLIDCGATVVVVDDLSTGRRANLRHCAADRLHFLRRDINDREGVVRAMKGVDVVFHLACLGVRHSLHAPAANHAVNATGALTVLEAARIAGIGRFVHVSTSEVYGNPFAAPIDENQPTFPNTVYGGAKLAGEAYARAFFLAYGAPVVIVRPFNAFGPNAHFEGDCGEAIPRFFLSALTGNELTIFGDGSQTRDFTFVDDIAAGLAAAGMAPGVEGETINLGSGREISIERLAEQIVALTGASPELIRYDAPRPGDTRRLCASVEKARRLLRYEPRVEFERGLRAICRCYAAKPAATLRAMHKQIARRNWTAATDDAR
jgi:UDP-glucose 4-epimerase